MRACASASSPCAPTLASRDFTSRFSAVWFFSSVAKLPLSCSSLPRLASAFLRRAASLSVTSLLLPPVSRARMRRSKAADTCAWSGEELKPSWEASMSAPRRAMTPPAIPAARCVKKRPEPVDLAAAGSTFGASWLVSLRCFGRGAACACTCTRWRRSGPAAPGAGLLALAGSTFAGSSDPLGSTTVALRSIVACGRLPAEPAEPAGSFLPGSSFLVFMSAQAPRALPSRRPPTMAERGDSRPIIEF